MLWLTLVSACATLALGVWLVRADRGHAARRPGLIVLGLLTLCVVWGLVELSPFSGTGPPARAPGSSPSHNPLVRVLLGLGLLGAGALTFWPAPAPMGKLVCGVLLSLLFAASLLCCLALALTVWWGSQGGAPSLWRLELGMAVLGMVVSAVGLMRHGPFFVEEA